MKGLVIKNTGSWYQVKTDDGQSIECKIKGNFRLKGIRSTNPVAVGDRVRIILNQEGTAFISEIEDRKNYIIRRSALEWLKSKKHWKARLLYFPDIRESANRLLSIPYCRA